MSSEQPAAGHGKRVSWVELYFDLVFVFAVSQVTHVIVADPGGDAVLSAFGLFMMLWWTWIGFVVLYNRRGDDRRTTHRLVILAGTVPCVVAATQAHHVFEGHAAGFILALAGARLLLATAYAVAARHGHRKADWRSAGGYALSVVILGLAGALHGTSVYVLCGLALVQETALLLLGERREQMRAWRQARTQRAQEGTGRRSREGSGHGSHEGHGRGSQERPGRRDLLLAQLNAPRDQAHAVDAAHLAERFGLFMIILLGEIVISVGSGALERPEQDLTYWLGLGGGLLLAAALWWVYFTSAADINERLLMASGGNPALAHTLYAGGHIMPAFSLLVVAAGVGLSLRGDAPTGALWLVTGGLAGYLAGTRVLTAMRRNWYAAPARVLTLGATASLAGLGHFLVAPVVVAAAACWTAGVAVFVTVTGRDVLRLAGEDPTAFLRGS
ncbi:low temperature requirement protein A [Sphaerisporangium fuscum]|uniref:low temperature requirement protein A n=1 Tax=Sphaerisporangium fuscum TaxID=2835868 RepID=UPI001BDD0AF3|nr:low temperature requirement protein A [Sphaerisporangium fuscum]